MTEPLGEVFLSYSWDSEEHIKSVLDLSDRLRSDGVDCVLDQYESSPAEGWPRWMDRKIRDSHFVLMVCTETYYRRVMGDESPDAGLGVRWEGNLIYQHIYNAGATNTKFLPVLLQPNDQKFIPTPLQGATRYKVDTPEGYGRLCFRLLNKAWIKKPKLGSVRDFPSPSLPKKEIKTDISMYLTTPIDLELWDEAEWRSAGFLIYKDKPPFLALGFLTEQPARKIFDQWRKRYGARDSFEELRVAIIEGDIKGEEPGYSVHIGPDVENTIKRYKAAGLSVNADRDIFMTISRIQRMNPSAESKFLEIFKEAYRHFKTYMLVPAIHEPGGSNFKPMLDLGIFKSSIHFRRVEEIDENDADFPVIGTGSVDRDHSDRGARNKRK
ncbi:MAG TPA: SEFIR domain-containing protein [Candidatus Saccharimonadales bacterium]|nr:SEFIR domain-containing protein [Candidatus Saccharimonadales bacterium]